MRKTIVVRGKRLIYSSQYHGYIDPEWHAGVRGSSVNEKPTVYRFRKTRRRIKYRVKHRRHMRK